MMYLFDFVSFLFNFFAESLSFLARIGVLGIECAGSLITLVTELPIWIVAPFYALISISVLFRVSQFIPTIGGAS